MNKALRLEKTLPIFTLLAAALLLQQTVSAQVPQTFNYQGIARDAGGNVLPNRKIGVELSVLDGGPTGTVVYAETFTDTTNAFGLFSMHVGGGTVLSEDGNAARDFERAGGTYAGGGGRDIPSGAAISQRAAGGIA